MEGEEPAGTADTPRTLSLGRLVRLCCAMFALESFISFEEIFMVSVLQRVNVPTALVSLPGLLSSIIGIFVIPLVGWATDRFTLPKRTYAFFSLLVCASGTALLVAVCVSSLYGPADPSSLDTPPLSNLTDPSALDIATLGPFNASDGSLGWPGGGGGGDGVDDDGGGGGYHGNDTAVVNVTRAVRGALNESTAFPFNSSSITATTTNPTNTTTPTNSTQPPSSTSSLGYLPALGGVSILGFVLADHGYDSAMSTVKTYVIAVTSSHQHDRLFVLSTLTGAVGGCVTSLLGFIDLAQLFPAGSLDSDSDSDSRDAGAARGLGRLDRGIAQCLAQAAVLLVSLVVLGAVSLLTGSHENSDRDAQTENNSHTAAYTAEKNTAEETSSAETRHFRGGVAEDVSAGTPQGHNGEKASAKSKISKPHEDEATARGQDEATAGSSRSSRSSWSSVYGSVKEGATYVPDRIMFSCS